MKGEKKREKSEKKNRQLERSEKKEKSFGCFHWVTMRVRLYAPSATTRYLGTFTTQRRNNVWRVINSINSKVIYHNTFDQLALAVTASQSQHQMKHSTRSNVVLLDTLIVVHLLAIPNQLLLLRRNTLLWLHKLLNIGGLLIYHTVSHHQKKSKNILLYLSRCAIKCCIISRTVRKATNLQYRSPERPVWSVVAKSLRVKISISCSTVTPYHTVFPVRDYKKEDQKNKNSYELANRPPKKTPPPIVILFHHWSYLETNLHYDSGFFVL